jgi:hypothetical protein
MFRWLEVYMAFSKANRAQSSIWSPVYTDYYYTHILNRPNAKTKNFLAHKQDLILLESSIETAFKAAATWQQLLGGVNREGKGILTDEESKHFAIELATGRRCHMTHYPLVFKKQCVEQPWGTKQNMLHIQISLPLQLYL